MIDPSGANEPSLTLHQLIRDRMVRYGWSYSELERRSGRALSRGRWQQLGSGATQRKFPDPASLSVIAEVLDVDITTVVLAAARAVGLDTRPPSSDLAGLLPPGTDTLSERMRDAILALIHGAIAEVQVDGGAPASGDAGLLLEWPKAVAPSRRHQNGPTDGI